MKKNEEHVPKVLREVWQGKDAIYQDVKHLPRTQALRAAMDNAHQTAERMRAAGLIGSAAGSMLASDGHGEYGAANKKRKRA